jgi:hypothetical protein
VDVDLVLVISEANFRAAEKALESIGLRSRLPVTSVDMFRYREEYIKNRNLVAWSFVNPKNPTELVDIVVTYDLKTMKIQKVTAGGHTLPVISIADIIRMKKASGRPQDLEDIKALETLRPRPLANSPTARDGSVAGERPSPSQPRNLTRDGPSSKKWLRPKHRGEGK